MPDPLLRIAGLHKRFAEVEVLKGIDLDVAQGEVVALIGASGSGKTTTLRCINVLEEFEQGTITLAGRRSATPARAPRAAACRSARWPRSARGSAWCSSSTTCSRT
jgi:ABC-type polar amino acid transport system ATPase subunit